jgi:uncharacterized delta-60 repeat protein
MRARLALVAALMVALAALAGVASAAGSGGGLDLSWGEGGVAKVPVPVIHEAGYETSGRPYVSTFGFAGGRDGSAYVVGSLRGCAKQCVEGPYLIRFDPQGAFDSGFGGGTTGRLELHSKSKVYTVAADASGRALVAYVEGEEVVLRRFTVAGAPDQSFGEGGAVRRPCACARRPQVRILPLPGQGVLLDVNTYTFKDKKETSRALLVRLNEDGSPDRAYGSGGQATVPLRRGELPRAASVAADGSLLMGGSYGPRPFWLVRVGPNGKPDARFDRNAASSVRRLSSIGEFPIVGALVPRPGGGLTAIGTIRHRIGFELRLRRDGRLVRGFGKRGAVRLPFSIESATAGTNGAIFAVGALEPFGPWRAFRILADGEPDPAFGGPEGLKVPLRGYPARVTPGAPGRPLVTDQGGFECIRQCAPSEPGLARYVE